MKWYYKSLWIGIEPKQISVTQSSFLLTKSHYTNNNREH